MQISGRREVQAESKANARNLRWEGAWLGQRAVRGPVWLKRKWAGRAWSKRRKERSKGVGKLNGAPQSHIFNYPCGWQVRLRLYNQGKDREISGEAIAVKKRQRWLAQEWWRPKTWLDSAYIVKAELAGSICWQIGHRVWGMGKEKNQGFQLEQLGRDSPFTELGNPGGRIHLERRSEAQICTHYIPRYMSQILLGHPNGVVG